MTSFSPGEDAWAARLGRLRDVVRQELVARQLSEAVDGRTGLRVLDVGCGQGTQALRLARAGHEVVGLDVSAPLLARFRADLEHEPADVRARVRFVEGPGAQAAELVGRGFDLVLCHGVLMYEEHDQPLLSVLSRCAAEDGTLSLLVRNGAALALRPGLLRDWTGAAAAVGEGRYVNRLDIAARAHAVDELDAVLARDGRRPAGWWGVRVLTDHLDEPAPAGEELEHLLAAEEALARTDPYRQVAALLHLLYR